MTERATQLLDTANMQIAELNKLLSTGSQHTLELTCPGREKLGDGTVGAVASHIANTYHRIAAVIRGDGNSEHDSAVAYNHHARTQNISLHQLLEELSDAQRALAALADLSDKQLDSIPPAGYARFCDGNRTLEQVLASMLKHQGHQVEAVNAAVHARTERSPREDKQKLGRSEHGD